MENEAGKRLAADPNKGKKIAALIAVGVIVILWLPTWYYALW